MIHTREVLIFEIDKELKDLNCLTKSYIRDIIQASEYGDLIQDLGLQTTTWDDLQEGFITEDALNVIIDDVFKVDSNGYYLETTSEIFGGILVCQTWKENFKHFAETMKAKGIHRTRTFELNE